MLAVVHDVSGTEMLMGVVVLYVLMVLGRACIVYFSNFRVVVFVKDAIFHSWIFHVHRMFIFSCANLNALNNIHVNNESLVMCFLSIL